MMVGVKCKYCKSRKLWSERGLQFHVHSAHKEELVSERLSLFGSEE